MDEFDENEFYDHDEVPTWQKRKEMIPKVKEAYTKLSRLLWDAQFGSDGSLGLSRARHRLDEAYMWALKDLKGSENEDF